MTILNGEPLEPERPRRDPRPTPSRAEIVPMRTLGLVSVLLAITVAPVGVIVAIVALVRSRRIGYRNILARGALIYGLAVSLFAVAVIVLAAVWGFAVFGPAFQVCQELGRGIWEIDGVIYRCNI